MGCGASSTSEPPSREGSAGKSRSENDDNTEIKNKKETENGQISNGEIKNKNLQLDEGGNNNGSQDSLNRKNKKNKNNKVDPLMLVEPGESF